MSLSIIYKISYKLNWVYVFDLVEYKVTSSVNVVDLKSMASSYSYKPDMLLLNGRKNCKMRLTKFGRLKELNKLANHVTHDLLNT